MFHRIGLVIRVINHKASSKMHFYSFKGKLYLRISQCFITIAANCQLLRWWAGADITFWMSHYFKIHIQKEILTKKMLNLIIFFVFGPINSP